MKSAKVVGISAVGGGGKTTITTRLVEVLGDAVAVHFDDYDDTNVHPAHLQRWFAEGGDYDAFQTPVFTCHLRTLRAGRGISSPDGATVGPARYVVADAPLGRAHSDSGRFIDLMVFVDTPLDVALARRTLRDIERAPRTMFDETLGHVKRELARYVARARPIYEHFQERMRAGADLIIDGTLGVDLVVGRIRAEVDLRWERPSMLRAARRRPRATAAPRPSIRRATAPKTACDDNRLCLLLTRAKIDNHRALWYHRTETQSGGP